MMENLRTLSPREVREFLAYKGEKRIGVHAFTGRFKSYPGFSASTAGS